MLLKEFKCIVCNIVILLHVTSYSPTLLMQTQVESFVNRDFCVLHMRLTSCEVWGIVVFIANQRLKTPVPGRFLTKQ